MAITQDLILTGVGIAQLVFPNGDILDIDEAQDMSIASSATMAEQTGGDSLYALLEFCTKLATKLTFTNARYTLSGVSAVTGTTKVTSAEVWNKEQVTVATGVFQLAKTANVILTGAIAKVVETGAVLTQITTGTPTATQFKLTTAGVGTVDVSLNGKAIAVSYYVTDATGETVNFLENTVPGNCELRYSLITEPMEDNKRYKVDIRAFRCKGTGGYTYDGKKGSAFSPKLEFSILNAGRIDKKVMVHAVTEYVEV